MQTNVNKQLEQLFFQTIRYTLVASAWSPCQVQDMNGNPAICGGGLQDRNISCLKTKGQKPVDLRLCSSLIQLTRVQRYIREYTKTGSKLKSKTTWHLFQIQVFLALYGYLSSRSMVGMVRMHP